MSELLDGEPTVLATGVVRLAEAVRAQAGRLVEVDWRPPPPGTEEDLARVAADLRRPAANATAVNRMLAAGARLVDVRPAAEVLGLARGEFLHAGPPVSWERASGPLRGALTGAAVLEERPEVIERLRWMGSVLGPSLQRAVRAREPIDIRALISQMLQMGDEGHNRNRAGSLLFLRELLPALIDSGAPASDVAEVVRFAAGNEHFFLNLVMPASKLATDAARPCRARPWW